jgi:xanthine dehydrogenase molybdenum-binding subunit
VIPFDFEYYKPATVVDALRTFRDLQTAGKRVCYYGGGTEWISLARLGSVTMDAVIDLKGIPECLTLTENDQHVLIGAAVSLTKVVEYRAFPLLSDHCRRIADHTSRNRITIGGNIAGVIEYREAVLPLLVGDAQVVVARGEGMETVSIHDIFKETLLIGTGEFIVQLLVPRSETVHPYVSLKKTRHSRVDYPLVSVAASKKDGWIRLAVSGVCRYPFRYKPLEVEVNAADRSPKERAERAAAQLPEPAVDNGFGSREYRMFLLRHALADTISQLEGVQA